MLENPYYLNTLKDAFEARCSAKSQYSLRAFARDLDAHPSTMSLILQGKRVPNRQVATEFTKKLQLSAVESTRFMESLEPKIRLDEIKIAEMPQFILDDTTYYKVIAQWEHYAALTLLDVDGFVLTPENVCEKIRITLERASEVIENLESAGLIERIDGTFEKTHAQVRTTEDASSRALRDSHLETLELGIEKLDSPDSYLRDYSSTTIAVDLEKLPEAKTVIREFRKKMYTLFKTGNKTDVYNLAIQLYPLTEPKAKLQ